MNKTFAHQAAPLALAAVLTAAMLLATNTLASHQYHVALASQASTQAVAMDVRHGTVVGHRAHA
jgi:hypothetical protein